MRIKRFLKMFMTFYRGFAWCEHVQWEDDDSKMLHKLLKTRAGRKLMNNLSAQSFEQDRLATIERMDPRGAGGVATGFRMALAYIQELSVVTTDERDESEANVDRPGDERFEQHTR